MIEGEEITFSRTPKLWKKARTEQVSADRQVCQGGGFLLAASLTADGGNATADIYDGNNTTGRLLLPLAALQAYGVNHSLNWGRYFDQGLYVDVGANVGKITVTYILLREFQNP